MDKEDYFKDIVKILLEKIDENSDEKLVTNNKRNKIITYNKYGKNTHYNKINYYNKK